jgi:hypothetical protein
MEPFSACLVSVLPAQFVWGMIPFPYLLRHNKGHLSGQSAWQVGFGYIAQEATSSYIELYGKKLLQEKLQPPGILWRDGVDLINNIFGCCCLP